MKKKVFAVSAILLCFAILAGGTAAYFTATDTAHNVITSGNVDIRVIEKQDVDGVLVDYPREPIDRVMPGSTISKIVTVENTGSGDAWIRVKVDKSITMKQPGDKADPSLLTLDYNTADWMEKDGWFYYRQPLAVGKTTTPLFRNVAVSTRMDNPYQGCAFDIDIHAQAVQSRNNPLPGTGDFSQIPGWPTNP